jgi:hypothetical protein
MPKKTTPKGLVARDKDYQNLLTELKSIIAKGQFTAYAFPDEVKKRGVMSFAFYPPHDDKFLVTQLWDKHMAKHWRERETKPAPAPDNEASKKIMEEMRKFREEGKPMDDESRVSSDKTDQMIIERKVLGKKGKWTRFPPEVMNRRKNEKGEWEDIEPDEQPDKTE